MWPLYLIIIEVQLIYFSVLLISIGTVYGIAFFKYNWLSKA
jgi:hypothetical protein